MAVWQVDITGSCSKNIEVIADTEEQAKQLACQEFERIWNRNEVHEHFHLFELDPWEATNATES
tara:strand:- start:451 stop:642 length:192 start_codon:yes stop_codon:yes gene_type:complete